MALKAKMFSMISAFIITLSMLIVGVFAAKNVQINMSGSLTFKSNDVNVIVSGNAVGTKNNPNFATLIFSGNEQPTQEELASWQQPLEFGRDQNQISDIVISISIENVSADKVVNVKIIDKVGQVIGINKSIVYNENQSYNSGSNYVLQAESVVTFIITIELENPDVSLSGATYGYVIEMKDPSYTQVNSSDKNLGTITSIETENNIVASAKFENTNVQFEGWVDDTTGEVVSWEMTDFVLPDNNKTYTAIFNALDSNLTYSLSTDNATIVDCNESTQNVTIPFYIKKEDQISKVIGIGDSAFENCNNLSEIFIPSTITSIGIGVFDNCSNLSSIIVDENNLVYDSRNDCNAIIEKATNTLIVGCKNSSIPNGVVAISNYAFANCTGLSSISIPATVQFLAPEAFIGCENLSSIVVDASNAIYDSRNNSNAIIEKATNTLILGCKTTVIPNGVVTIGKNAFANCTGLTSITIPDSVSSIQPSAFFGCTGLQSVVFANKYLWQVSNSINFAQISIVDVNDANNAKNYITNNYVNYYWRRVDILSSSNTSLGSISYSINGQQVIGNANFVANAQFEGWQDANGNVISWEMNNFVVPDLTKTYTAVFNNLAYNTANSTVAGYTGNSSKVVIPSYVNNNGIYKVNAIGQEAFFNKTSLTTVILPNTLTTIGKDSFKQSGITSINIPEGVTLIDGYAFLNCSSLASVTLPSTLTTINTQAFMNTSITSITIPANVNWIGNKAFKDLKLTSVVFENPNGWEYKAVLWYSVDVDLSNPSKAAEALSTHWRYSGNDWRR